MSFDGTGFLEFCIDIVSEPINPSNGEAELRAALSRAYYAAFLKARHYLLHVENFTGLQQTGADHGIVHREIRLAARRKGQYIIGQDIFNGLRKLKRARSAADYDEVYPSLVTDTPIILSLAIDTIDKIAKL